MPDLTIGQLPAAPSVSDAALFVIEQQGVAQSVTGAQWKAYAQQATAAQVQAAQDAATQAGESAQAAANSASEAAQSATAAAGSAQSAQQYSGKPPQIQNGTWWIWNATTQQYEDTGEAVRGNVMFATFSVDPKSGELTMSTPDEYQGPQFYLINGILEVSVENA